MRDSYFASRNSVLWRQGAHDHKEYTQTALERLERHYDDEGKPLPQWTATLAAYTFADIDALRNFPESAEVTITYKPHGRRDFFRTEEVLLRMNNCRPVRGWFENLVVFVGDGWESVPYKLLVVCDVDYLFDAQKLADEEARVASIKKTTVESATEKPKTLWEKITG